MLRMVPSTARILLCRNFSPLPLHACVGETLSGASFHQYLKSSQPMPRGMFCCRDDTKGKDNIKSQSRRSYKTLVIHEKKKAVAAREKRRTRSNREFDEELLSPYIFQGAHVPVLIGEVLEVFGGRHLRSFVDCTVGAAGHSSAIIQDHSEMHLFIGLDVDPVAHQEAQTKIYSILNSGSCNTSNLKIYTLLRNFKQIKCVLHEVDESLLESGVDGILMDLGVSSMQVNDAARGFSLLNNGPLDMRMNQQASLKAGDIVNSWPVAEVGRILRDYGEESNWRSLQNKIARARLNGGLHSTGELVELIKTTSGKSGRHGWIKTATRVFQALRIAVNDELKTLEDALYSCFDCLAPGGQLAVISFHSLEDRIVKQTFLNIIHGECRNDEIFCNSNEEESWCKKTIRGAHGTILTKRPITPSEEEERLNRKCRSAKLRVIQKVSN